MEKSPNIQYPSIFNMVQCPSPQALPYNSKTGCAKRGGPRGGEENDKEMHRDIHIQQKRKKKERGGKKKKTTLSLCLHPKVAVHTYFHTSDDTRER